MALFVAGPAVEAAGVSWRFRGSKNTPFKPVDLPLPVSCGEVRAALKEEIGLVHTPQLDALLFFAEEEETSQAGVAAPAPLSDFLTLCRPCRVVLQRTSAAAAAEALARADAVFQGAAQRHEKQPQQSQGRTAHHGQPERQGGEGMSVPLSSEHRPEQAGESNATSHVHGQRGTGAGQQRQPLLVPAGGKTGGAAAPAESVRLTPAFQQQQHPHHVQRLQQEGPEGASDRAAEEEAQEAEDRAADEEAEAALLHAVIEQHAEHRGPQHQQAASEAGTGLRGGWGKDGKGGAWGGVSGGLQQLHGRRNLVWSRDGVGSSSAASVAAATTCIPMAAEGGGAFAAYGRGAAGAARGGGGGSGAGAGSGSCYYGYCYYYPVDADYICHFCGERGTHHIKNCSKAQDPRQQKKVKPATGIPSSFLQDIDVSDIPAYQEVYIRRDGSFAVMKNTKKLSSHSFFSLDLETKVERHTGNSSCTSQLRCGLCNTLFKNPVITPCCGETFCRGCLLRALQQQLMLNGFEEQQQYGLFSTIRGKVETADGFARVKQELPATERYLPRAAVVDGAMERGRRCRGSLQQSKAHGGAVGNALRVAKGGGRFGAGGAAARKAVRGGGLCPACGSALDLKDVVDNVALRKCVDAIVLPSSSHEDSTAQAVHQKQQQQNKQQEQQPQWQQQQQTQQQTRRLVKGQRGGGGVQQQLQDQVNQKKVQSLFVVKQEEQQQVKKEQQQMQLQSRAAAIASATPANPTFATHSSDSREEVSTAGASVVSAARVVVKTEAGAATSSSATPVNPPSSGVASLDSNGSSSASVLPLASLFSDVKKIQHHEDSPAVPPAAAADTHKTSADAASAATVAPSGTSVLAGFCAGLQSTVPQQHETTGTVVATAAPTITRSGSTQHDAKVEEQRTGSSTVAVSRSSTGGSNDSHSSASSINQSTTSDTHITTAAADGSAAAVHVSGGPPPLLPAASPPHYASGASRASGMNSSPNSCYSSSSCEAVHGVVQGEKTDSSVVTSAGTTDTGASGAETQGDRASTSKSGVLTGLDISQLQEQQDFAAAYIQQYMERKKDKVKKRKKKRRRHAESSSTETDSSSSEERSHGKKYKKRKKRMSGHHSKGR